MKKGKRNRLEESQPMLCPRSLPCSAVACCPQTIPQKQPWAVASLSQVAVMPLQAGTMIPTVDDMRQAEGSAHGKLSFHILDFHPKIPSSCCQLLPESSPLLCHSQARKGFFTAGMGMAALAAASSSPHRKQPFLLCSPVKLLKKSQTRLHTHQFSPPLFFKAQKASLTSFPRGLGPA